MFASDLQPVRSTTFEGPLELLLELAQRHEIDLRAIALAEIARDTSQDIELEQGAEFIGLLSSLLLMKSAALLPSEELQHGEAGDEPDMRLDLLQQVIEYCSFREAANHLSALESAEGSHFMRAPVESGRRGAFPVETVSLSELSDLLDEVLKRASSAACPLQAERWSVSAAIARLRTQLAEDDSLLFSAVFTSEKCREELIVLFLALLELMKLGELTLSRAREPSDILIRGARS